MLTPDERTVLRRRIDFRRQMGNERVSVTLPELTALLDAADELDRLRQEKRAEQVERIKAEHLRIRVQGKSYCVVDGMEWPCLSIKNLEPDSKLGI